MRRSMGVASVLLTVLAVGVAGCSGGSGSAAPTPAPTPTSASTVAVVSSRTPTATPTDPRAQVLAAVREYFDAANYAIQTGDTTRLRAVTMAGCPCQGVADTVDERQRRGWRTPGAVFRLTEAEITDVLETAAGVDVRFLVPKYEVLDARGNYVKTVPEFRSHAILDLVLIRGHWQISQMTTLESSR